MQKIHIFHVFTCLSSKKHIVRFTWLSYLDFNRLQQKIYTMLMDYELYVMHYSCCHTGTFPHISVQLRSLPCNKDRFLRKQQFFLFLELTTDLHKSINCFWKYIQIKGNVILDTIQYFGYASSCLQAKSFARGQSFAISFKLQMSRR